MPARLATFRKFGDEPSASVPASGPLIVVMGHDACGVVQAAVSVVRNQTRYPGNIGKMIQPIIPAVLEADLTLTSGIEPAVRQNVRRVVRELREEASPMILDAQAQRRLLVVGAYYELESGKVDFFDLPSPAMSANSCSEKASSRQSPIASVTRRTCQGAKPPFVNVRGVRA